VDNNSTDGSVDDAERLFPELRVIRNSKNLGFAEGNNEGIRNSSGDLVLLANNDIVLNSNAIASLMDCLHDDTGIVGGLIYYSKGGKIWAYGGHFDAATGMHWHLLQGMSQASSAPERLEVDYVPGALLLVRRSILDQVGLLDQYFFLYGDDIDLALKARRLGYSVMVTSSAVAYHIVSQGVKKLEQRHELLGYYMMNRNMFYLYFVQLPIPFALSSTLFQVAFLLFEVLLFRRPKSFVRVKITAFGHALGDINRAWQARNRVKKLGQLKIKLKLRELLGTTRSRANSRTYYW
jgi:GT2 family glycosyltransferase